MIKFESEKHLEMFIADCFDSDNVCLIDNEEYDECVSQFDTKSYGMPDLVFHSTYSELDDDENEFEIRKVHVVELKNEQIKLSHIAQIARYKTYFERALNGFNVEMKFSLVVPDGVVNNDDCCWLINSLDEIDVYEFKLNPKAGIEFNKSKGWYKNGVKYNSAIEMLDLNEDERGLY